MSWWQQATVRRSIVSKILHHPLFFTPKRNSFNYIFPKLHMAEVVWHHRKEKVDKLLIAPCGAGDDVEYLNQFAHEIHGIDLSPLAIKRCPPTMKAKVGDILQSGYQDGTFDLIASPLFFHHLLKFGFEPFLNEFHRIMKTGAGLVILEPSIWYPLNIITRPMKRVFRNPFGEVEDEGPFHPELMLESLRHTGFKNIEIHGASFSHNSLYVPFAKLLNRLTKPLLDAGPLRYLAWMVIYWAEKSE